MNNAVRIASKSDDDPDSVAGITKMMKMLFAEQESKHQKRFDEFESRQHSEIKRTILFAIGKQIQSFHSAIDAERAEQMQAVANIEVQIAELRQEFLAVTSSSSQRPLEVVRLDEIVIGGFGFKSKEVAIMMIEKVIDGTGGNPIILKEKVSLAPKVVHIKFDSTGDAQDFVCRHFRKEVTFPCKFDCF